MNSLQHIHPTFWFAGMKWSKIQILFHDPDIGTYDVNITGEGVSLADVIRPSNCNYLLLYVETSGAPAQTFHIHLSNGNTIKDIPYELREREFIDIQTFDSHDVVYLMIPDRWADGTEDQWKKSLKYKGLYDDRWNQRTNHTDSNGFHTRHGGDIAGMVRHLDYWVNLGVTTIWPTPLVENDSKLYSYHGYSATDLYRIDPRLGTNEEYFDFVRLANRKGLKIIMDMVFNHVSEFNFLWTDRMAEWFYVEDPLMISNYKTYIQSDKYASVQDQKVFLHGWFNGLMPVLDGTNPLVQDYLIQNSLWWIEYAGINGIRQDTYPYNDFEEMRRWCMAIEAEHPGFNIVGETFMKSPVSISYWQKDSPVNQRNSHLPTVMDFPLWELLKHVCDEETSDWSWGLSSIQEYLANDRIYAHPNHLLTFLSNHDVDRFTTSWNIGQNNVRYKQALTLILTLRGIPQLYYGDEICMPGVKDESDFQQRQHFPGGFSEDYTDVFREKNMNEQMWEYYNFTRRMLNWRKDSRINHIIAEGEFVHHAVCNGIYVYARIFGDSMITVCMNGTWEQRSIDPTLYSDVIPKKFGKDILSGRFFSMKKEIIMNPRDILIFDWDS